MPKLLLLNIGLEGAYIDKKEEFKEAEKVFGDVETMQNEVLGEKHVDTLTTKHWIARCLYEKK